VAVEPDRVTLERGTFTISLDFELLWGTMDVFGPEVFREACERERSEVFPRLLGLLEAYEIPATWCVLGHLMLGSCARVNGRKHPEIVRPQHSWHPDDWFVHDPCGDEEGFPVFYGRSLVEALRECPVAQEIGCHGFSHAVFGDPGCSRETAETEVRACVRTARDLGIELRSFAFPRNRVGHLDVLRQHGFTSFRGPEPTWHGGGTGGGTGALRRAGHLADVLSARRPPTTLPARVGGLINLPASMAYFPMHGGRRHIPVSRRVTRIRKGIEDAVGRRRLFHIWFHPTNLAHETDAMLGGLEAVFRDVADRRDRRELEVLSMGGLASRVAAVDAA
jgi:peptidoglycan/xylan/chitin deacetylase (PgdA/CDA1 family)